MRSEAAVRAESRISFETASSRRPCFPSEAQANLRCPAGGDPDTLGHASDTGRDGTGAEMAEQQIGDGGVGRGPTISAEAGASEKAGHVDLSLFPAWNASSQGNDGDATREVAECAHVRAHKVRWPGLRNATPAIGFVECRGCYRALCLIPSHPSHVISRYSRDTASSDSSQRSRAEEPEEEHPARHNPARTS